MLNTQAIGAKGMRDTDLNSAVIAFAKHTNRRI